MAPLASLPVPDLKISPLRRPRKVTEGPRQIFILTHSRGILAASPTFCPPSGGSLRAAQAPRVSPPLHTSQSLQGGGGGVSEAFAVGPIAQGITSAPLTSCPQGPARRPRWARLLYGRRQRWQPLGRGFERPSWRRWQGHRNSEYRTVTAGLQARPPAFEL